MAAIDAILHASVDTVKRSGIIENSALMGTVSVVNANGTVDVTRASDTYPSVRTLVSYQNPAVGDLVEMVKTAGGWVCVGVLATAPMVNKTVVKQAATARASSTTLANDPELGIALPGAGTYAFDIFVNYTGALLGQGDLKVAMDYSGTQSFGVWMGQGVDVSANTAYHGYGQSIVNTSTQTFGANGGSFTVLRIAGSLFATSGGNLAFRWAQNTSSTTATTVRQGSWMHVWTAR